MKSSTTGRVEATPSRNYGATTSSLGKRKLPSVSTLQGSARHRSDSARQQAVTTRQGGAGPSNYYERAQKNAAMHQELNALVASGRTHLRIGSPHYSPTAYPAPDAIPVAPAVAPDAAPHGATPFVSLADLATCSDSRGFIPNTPGSRVFNNLILD